MDLQSRRGGINIQMEMKDMTKKRDKAIKNVANEMETRLFDWSINL